jgi:hypothetical protein
VSAEGDAAGAYWAAWGGHSDIRTTYNRYGHLMPGGEGEDADRLAVFLDGSVDQRVDESPHRNGAEPSEVERNGIRPLAGKTL